MRYQADIHEGVSIGATQEPARLKGLTIYLLFSCLFLVTSSHAQTPDNDYLERVGRPDFAVLEPIENGFLNVANGNMHLEFPLATVPQRGGKTITVKLTYDSRIWSWAFTPQAAWFPSGVHGSNTGGWKVVATGAANQLLQSPMTPGYFNVGRSNMTEEFPCELMGGTPDHYFLFSRFTWEAVDGTAHTFWIQTYASPGLGTCPADMPSGSALADDGSGFRMDVTNYTDYVVYDASGNKLDDNRTGFWPAVLHQDTNGNFTGINSNGDIVDELGRVPVITTISGNTTYYDVLNSQGTRSRFTVTKASINVNTAFGLPYTAEFNGTINTVSSLTLPNGTSYLFQYDSGTAPGNYGLLSSMQLPTGAVIQFGYSNFTDAIGGSTNGVNRWLTSRNSAGNLWTYSPLVTGPGMQQVTMTRPNQESIVYSFTAGDGYGAWNTSAVYNDSTGNTVKTELKDYTPPFGPRNVPPIFFSYLPIRLTTSYPVTGGNISKKTEYSYDSVFSANVSEVREWDWYTGTAPATPSRVTDATYTAASAAYAASNILNRVTSVVVKNGLGTQMAKNILEYDNYTAGLSASGAVQHDSTFGINYTLRGNRTATQTWRNTDGTLLTTRNQYDDAGNALSIMDPGGHTTTTSYADSWGDTHCAPGTGSAAAFPTTVTNALNQSTKATYNSCTGKIASSTDLNNQTTNFYYNDPMDRLTQTLLPPDPNGNRPQTTKQFNESNLPFSVTTTSTITPSLNQVSTVVGDSFGRESIQTLTTDPMGSSSTLTTYDFMNRKARVYNPTRCSPPDTNCGESTWGYIAYSYDMLGRGTTVTSQDGGVISNHFDGNCGTVTDPAGNQRRTCSDGLGRLIEVDEPTGGSPGVPGAGSATVMGSEQSAQVLVSAASSGTGTVQLGGAVQWKTVASASTAGTTNITISGSEQQNPAGTTPGMGSITISGAEQSLAAATAAGSVTINGTLQSKQVQTQAASPATGSVTISGTEQSKPPVSGAAGTGSVAINGGDSVYVTDPCLDEGDAWSCPTWNYDYGVVNVIVNGHTDSTGYGQGSTPNGLASSLAAVINGDAGAPVTAAASSNILYFTARQGGAASNYSWSVSGQSTTGDPMFDPNGSFANPASSGALSGGTDAVPAIYDSGTCTVTVNGTPYQTTFGQGDTYAAIASRLASTIGAGSLASATASGGGISLATKSSGAATNYSLSSSCTYNSSKFTAPSFTTSNSGSALSGGHDAVYTTVYDSGTCTITVAGHGDSKSWSGSGTTAAGIASGLASAISTDGSATINASASSNIVNLTAKTAGAAGNYSLSSSCGYDSSNFPGPSFTISNSGSALTGGRDLTYDAGTFSVTVNGHTTTPSSAWNSSSTPASIAVDLAAKINADTAAFVTATASGATVNLTAINKGTISNYAFTVASTYDSAHFSHASFTNSNSGATLTGGSPNNNAVDSGTMTVTINGSNYGVNWGQTDNATSIASKLATALAANTAVTTTLSGTTLTLDPKTAGTAYSFSTAFTYDTADFAHSSFTPSSSVSDYGTATIAVNGHNDSVLWAGHDSPSTVATALASKINGDSGSVVTASASGSTVSLTARTTGAQTNYSLGSSTAYDTAHFAASSFSSTNSGSALAGGANAVYNTVYDSGTVTLTVNGTNYSVTYGQNDTVATIASGLAAKINAGGVVNADASGATLALKADSAGVATNYSLAASSSSSQPSLFYSPSFTGSVSGAAMGGGTDGTPGSLANPYVTLYSYDTLNNLLRVDQKGSSSNDSSQWRTRTFTYDSLSRLLTAFNPETGTISYNYDADGNLLQKTSPAPNQTGAATLTVSYCYDALHRVLAKGYSNPNPQQCAGNPAALPNPAVTYTYDQGSQAANAIGRLTSMADQAGSSSYTYDVLGRMASETRTINPGSPLNPVSKTVSYEYNLDGSLKTLHYPSGAAVTYTPDSAGRMVSAVDSGNTINYATSATYDPDGALTGFVSGKTASFAGIANNFSFDKRHQPIFMSASAPSQTVFSIGYDFHLGNGDNGTVYGVINYRDSTRNQTFTYDALNRLISAQNAGTDCSQPTLNPPQTKFWGNNYAYDAWGNLLSKSVTKCAAENLSTQVLNNNQLVGYGYDAAGNMTSDPTDAVTAVYDQENRVSSATKNTVTTTYAYDGHGNRVEKSTGSNPPTGVLYWYMSPGIVAESDLTGALKSEYVFFNGERVARRDGVNGAGGVFYYFSDRLKTADVVTDANATILSESDFYPWGGELRFIANDSNHYKFTGKERDQETGLDYFGARYYSNGLGRFVTPDWAEKPIAVPYADFGNPQSLNLYSYGHNNPTSLADADGHCPIGMPCITPDQTVTLAWLWFKQAHPQAAFALSHPPRMGFDLYYHQGAWRDPNAVNLSTDTVRFALSLGLQEDPAGRSLGTQVNAMRHTLWSAAMTVKYGPELAKEAADSHEQNPNVDLSIRTFSGKNALGDADQTIDLLNNIVGRDIGKEHPGATMLQLTGLILDYYHANGLYGAKENADGTVSVVVTPLSQAELDKARTELFNLDEHGRKHKKKDADRLKNPEAIN